MPSALLYDNTCLRRNEKGGKLIVATNTLRIKSDLPKINDEMDESYFQTSNLLNKF